MIVSKLLTYDDNETETWVDFYFNENQIQAVFVSKDGYICAVLSGQIYELEYNQELFKMLKHNLSIKTLGFN